LNIYVLDPNLHAYFEDGFLCPRSKFDITKILKDKSISFLSQRKCV